MLTREERIPRSTSLPEEVARRLRDLMDAGEWQPGGQLPSQHELSATFGVSRSVVREAISLLKSEGLVTSHQGRGQFVSLEGPTSFHLNPNLEDRDDLAALIELLLPFETAAAALAAERRTDADLVDIRRALEALACAVARGEPGIIEDMRFHQEILRASHNRYFQNFGGFVDQRVRRLIRTARGHTRAIGLSEQVQEEHQAIYDAVVAGDAGRARTAAATHLTNAAARLRLYRAGA